jgi:HTH-type transcriptional regulator / antitoxin HigA
VIIPAKEAVGSFTVLNAKGNSYRLILSNTPPHEFLQFLLEARGWKQMDLVGVVSSSKGVVSAMVNGKRGIRKAQAKKLAEIFHVPIGAFL